MLNHLYSDFEGLLNDSLREHLRRSTCGELFAILQNKDAIRVLGGQIQVVDHGQYAGRLTGEVAGGGQNPMLVRKIEIGCGLNEQKISPAVRRLLSDLRKSPRELHPLLLTSR